MPKITDRATICWKDKNDNIITEEVITYECLDAEEEEIEEESAATPESSSTFSFTNVSALSTDESEDNDFEKLMVTLVLEDLLEKLAILRCTSQGEHSPMTIKYPEYKTLDDRYGQVLEFEENQFSESKKRYADLNMIYSVIYKTLEQMGLNGSYAPLVEATRIMKKTFEDEEKLEVDEEETRNQEEELKRQLHSQRKELESTYNDKLEQLRLLEVAHEDAIAYGKLEYKYLENWEAARLHQAQVIQEQDENNYRDIISTNKTNIELENRIHGELVRYFDENAEDLSNETTYWMYRYETEMETREAELLKLRMDRDAQMEKYMQLKATYESQKEFIDHWNKVREERRIAAEIHAKQTAAAKKIQDWWRRTMKRLKIGPYGKKKKGKKGGKKEK
ncbi:dynein regulatory complex protein 9-like [Atheta coriaria]|uniref:dynein regulatory complex protein 9-like n=1 Tax=Dalotia coriaria TaxID=877792 RepID=UPI0031F45F72